MTIHFPKTSKRVYVPFTGYGKTVEGDTTLRATAQQQEDYRYYYEFHNQEIITQTNNILSFGTVPANKVFLLQSFEMSMGVYTGGASTGLTYGKCTLVFNVGSLSYTLGTLFAYVQDVSGTQTGKEENLYFHFPVPLVFPAGTSFQMLNNVGTDASIANFVTTLFGWLEDVQNQ